MDDPRIGELEHSAWSMFSFMGRAPGGRIVDSPTRLVIETPVARPPYNAVMRFYDEGDQPLRDQATALLAPMARSLYQRMGYEDIATFGVWAAPDTVHL